MRQPCRVCATKQQFPEGQRANRLAAPSDQVHVAVAVKVDDNGYVNVYVNVDVYGISSKGFDQVHIAVAVKVHGSGYVNVYVNVDVYGIRQRGSTRFTSPLQSRSTTLAT